MRLFVGLLIILFISVITADGVKNKHTLIRLFQQVYKWVIRICDTIENHRNRDISLENIFHNMKQIEKFSFKLDLLESMLNIKLNSILNYSLDDIKIQVNFIQLKRKLRISLIKIDHYFHQIREYELGKFFGNETLKLFAHKILWSSGSVSNYLNNIQTVFIPTTASEESFLSLMLQSTNLSLLQKCDTQVSMQQNIYYLYMELIITEMKGFLVQLHCLTLKKFFDDSPYDYVTELEITKRDTGLRLNVYQQLFYSMINQFSQHLRRCDAHAPQRGVHFLEMQKFSQIKIFDSLFMPFYACGSCSKKSVINAFSIRTNDIITDCKEIGISIKTCPAPPGSHREILWWEDSKGNHYGPNVSCPKILYRYGRFAESNGQGGYHYMNCQLCACSVEMNHDGKEKSIRIWRISTTEQTSDYRNNKVITGIKFVTCNNTLHLQIKQAEFSQNGLYYENNEWKALDIGYYNRSINHVRRPIISVPLRHDRKSMYLDDISAPEGYAVTGVRFQLVNDLAFKLQISVAEFDIMSGLIHPSSNSWIDASTNPMRPDDYKKERSEINMGASDDPTRGSEFKYNFESNQLIKFTHTDINKDGGQTTIPLLEAQAVETNPAFPLSGIGLTFKGREHYGGYITPRIYTLDVTKYMRSSQNEKVQPNQELNITDYVIHTLDGKVYFASDYDRYTIDKFNTSSMIVKGQD